MTQQSKSTTAASDRMAHARAVRAELQGKPTAEARVRAARKAANDAIAHGVVINANPDLARATRSRAAYKYQAEALQRVLRILNGERNVR